MCFPYMTMNWFPEHMEKSYRLIRKVQHLIENGQKIVVGIFTTEETQTSNKHMTHEKYSNSLAVTEMQIKTIL